MGETVVERWVYVLCACRRLHIREWMDGVASVPCDVSGRWRTKCGSRASVPRSIRLDHVRLWRRSAEAMGVITSREAGMWPKPLCIGLVHKYSVGLSTDMHTRPINHDLTNKQGAKPGRGAESESCYAGQSEVSLMQRSSTAAEAADSPGRRATSAHRSLSTLSLRCMQPMSRILSRKCLALTVLVNAPATI